MYKPPTALIPFIYLPALAYQAGVRWRNRAYDRGLLSVARVPRPVVSVGNLTLGGTGKTPFVIYLATLLSRAGYEIAILTRGYGRRSGATPIILAPEHGLALPATTLGDEPALLRRRLPEAWLGIGGNRQQNAAAIAGQSWRVIFILDDGLQHRRLHRDLDIVMVDATRPLWRERLFPLGTLREPVRELRRAHIVVINRDGSDGSDAGAAGDTGSGASATYRGVVSDVDELRQYAPQAAFFYCWQRIRALVPFDVWLSGGNNTLSSVRPPQTVFLVAAIGNPARFRLDMEALDIQVRGTAFLPDHAALPPAAWEKWLTEARKVKAEAIVITEKDAVKLSGAPDFPLLVAVQVTEMASGDRFMDLVRSRVTG